MIIMHVLKRKQGVIFVREICSATMYSRDKYCYVVFIFTAAYGLLILRMGVVV